MIGFKFAAPHHKHLVVDVRVTSACKNANVPVVWAPLPLLGNLALG
jgi:hypothetical protein